jgi:hypothetical protein
LEVFLRGVRLGLTHLQQGRHTCGEKVVTMW